MGQVARFGVSIERSLLQQFDKLIRKRGYNSRSEAIRDLIRSALVEQEWQHGRTKTIGVVCVVYDHTISDLAHRLAHMQHESSERVVSSLHVHLDEHNCLEIVVLRGRPSEVKEIADRLISLRRVKHGQLLMATTAKRLS